jgi:glycosyltransferase involved in cell wall biosynthesis
MKPVLFVTGHVPPDRLGAFARLHELEEVELALFGGRSRHGPAALTGAWTAELAFPHRRVSQRDAGRLAASGRYRAVVCSTGGRIALPAAWAGARRARAPLILWASLWAHPRGAAHLLSYPALRRLYRSADAIVTYGPHVSAYVRDRGARNVHVAPQSVDNDFWSAPVSGTPGDPAWPREAQVKLMFAGRMDREKGVEVLTKAWRASGLKEPAAALVLVGAGPTATGASPGTSGASPRGEMAAPRDMASPARARVLGAVPPERLREMYADADVLIVPSIRTRTFREPWSLVVNEAMNRGLPVIASDAVGAVAGGLVRDGRNGLVVPAGDAGALARAMRRLTDEREQRARLGAAGAEDVRAYTHEAWAMGFSKALATVKLSRAL